MGCTPLSYAAECGAYQIAKLLTTSPFHCKTDEVDKDGCRLCQKGVREMPYNRSSQANSGTFRGGA